MKVRSQQAGLYFLLLLIAAGLFIIALGPGLWNAQSHMSLAQSWQHEVFDILCHQSPERSFTLNGATMAVCSRCIGIYSAFFLGVGAMPLIARLDQTSTRFHLWVMIAITLLNIVDVLINLSDIWNNSLYSRWLMGTLLGLSVTWYLTEEFFTQTLNKEFGYGK